jgi:hypothetical protein
MISSSSSEEIWGVEGGDDVPALAATRVLVAARYQRVVETAIFYGSIALEVSA